VLAAIPASMLFGGILAGGNLLEARVQVPNAIVNVIQGSIIVAAAGSAFLLRRNQPVVADSAADVDDDQQRETGPEKTVGALI
jgi:ABC-type uncharacterized transport system permease subunit